MNPAQALAVTLVDELVRAGVRDACLAPGSRSAPLALALASDGRVSVHVLIDERSAAFLALGIGKAGRRPAVLVSTSGTAAAHFHPAVLEAHHSKTPLIVITADRPPELRDTGAGQTIDQIKLYGDAVRWFVEVGVPEDRPGSARYWRSVAARACATATGSPAGPVHLNAAFRDPLVPARGELGDREGDAPEGLGGREGGAPWTQVRRSPPMAAEDDVAWLAGQIAGSTRGLVVAGDCDVDPGPVLALADKAGWPVLADPLSGLRSGKLAISAYDALLRNHAWANEHRPDVVLRVGKIGTSKTLRALVSGAGREIVIDADGMWLDAERSAATLLIADPASVCGRVCGAIPARSKSRWSEGWRRAEIRARGAVDGLLDLDDDVSEPRTARDLGGLLPDGATLVVASSMPVRDLDWYMRPRQGLRVLGNRGANGIDGFVSTTLGVALASPEPTVGLAGDLSILHDQNGLMLRRAEPVNTVFVVINNDGGGIFSFLPQARWPENFEQLFGTPHGLSLAALAELYGCGHRSVKRASELAPAVAGAMEQGGVHLVEVRTDRAANVTLHRRLNQAVADTL
ncbi:MAG: 2-succinyl-5-enolpyruvyl-6-hydroxy-3-cyclohexene-1-carboxylic-acid synthase [Actinobacteria bacterium]|nr:2-succinyl-5-enolpyruvyl-6-hydroxy-3-cyclohexene-1-carboxylic-acid synthase [Actinomycetota bacterium]MDQ3531842.1 2-succinyl-5-enolpyruvyl-6-hydroxy-3-cyclohexene-1-carboxylic-acid synthase [Actinomycetota bacterium]